jgi:hypothetical protein
MSELAGRLDLLGDAPDVIAQRLSFVCEVYEDATFISTVARARTLPDT